MSKRSYLCKKDKLYLEALFKEKIIDILNKVDEAPDRLIIVYYEGIIELLTVANKLNININKIIEPEELLYIKKYLNLYGVGSSV